MAHHVHDEGFHEIQLNGKQLVFLFMAATVVSVVIFLCGVLVGRGVRAERSIGVESAANAVDAAPQPATAVPQPPPAAGSDPTTAAPPTDDLSYFNRLEKSKAPAEQLKPASEHASAPARDRSGTPAAPAEKSASVPAPASAPAPAPASAPPPARAAAAPPPAAVSSPKPQPAARSEPARAASAPATEAGSTEPAGQGFAVQIAALNVRSEADAIARRLSSKGYAAYVISPANGTPSVYRVRVGKFPTRREAESVAAKLQKEEQFKPWVTR